MKNLQIPGEPTSGWLLLMGGGEFSFGETREFDEFLLSKLPADNRTIAFVPVASGSNEYAVHLGAWLRTIDPSVDVVNVPIYRPRDARRLKNLERLESAGLVYLGAGVTNKVIEALRGSPVVECLGRVLAAGKTVAAIGAAAAAMGVATHDIERPGSWLPGLGLVPGTVIETGFDPADDTPLRRLMSLPEARLGVAIPRNAAVAVAPDRSATILGAGQIAVVRKA
ncbi:MAG: Type 1 glutamine amidotransferase-like domain-containing protein [Thermoanaerobaculia bacterium]|nr:Type 1 glutamine amidotransferase-like domain-containing protein [Thermoanaerobaculia bacterium]